MFNYLQLLVNLANVVHKDMSLFGLQKHHIPVMNMLMTDLELSTCDWIFYDGY